MRKLIRSIFVCPKRSDTILSMAIYALLVFGIIVTSSARINTGATVKATISALGKTAAIVLLCVVAYHVVSNYFSTEKFGVGSMYAVIILELGLLFGAVVCCYLQGPKNGNYSWIYAKWLPFDIQPSEFAKIVVILIAAVFFCDKRFNGFHFYSRAIMRPLGVFLVMVLTVAFIQKDMGTAFAIAAIGVLVFLLPSNRVLIPWQIFAVFGIVLVGFGYSYLLTEAGQEFLKSIGLAHIAARFQAVYHPSYTNDATREIFYSLLGISKGSILGVGLGNSVQKFGYLVSAEADYIFAIIAEELGLIGIAIVFAGYFIIIWRLIHYSRRVMKEADKAILIGTVCYLFVHFFMNIGGVSGLIPLTGVPLLLISHGGSAMLSIMICLGLCQAVIDRHLKSREERRKLIA
ncbi:MAG: FtsW/RodA/SpoVE family cell cycle protein [Erysipelotrichaceae bacterium]|nr:FtsW/RodA/SpoVE family cell cycle protein [Erysipelotrichaceae bacterium]